ncbi:hypothetical protein CGCVW01_v013194 [Colletotrichum viniferum]|nr:hypothetical protein CGCVW01_v013194 [Colletotrichum viniferum]
MMWSDRELTALVQKKGGMTTQNARTKARTIPINAYRTHVVDLLVQSWDCNTSARHLDVRDARLEEAR